MTIFSRRFASAVIVATVSFAGFMVAHQVIEASVHSLSNNVFLIQNALYVCKPIPFQKGERMVVLRLDDVQAYTWAGITTRMIDDSISHGFPVVAGVIPKGLLDDKDMTRFLRQRSCNVEMALHGWDHGSSASDGFGSAGEFEFLTQEEAAGRMEMGLVVLSQLTDKPIYTFIPPQNEISEGSKQALKDEGISVLSGEGDEYYDYAAATWDYATNSFADAGQVETQCEDHLATSDVCVIMLHPQDFAKPDGSLDSVRYKEFVKVLNYLSANSITGATLAEIEQAD